MKSSHNLPILAQRSATTIARYLSCAQGCWLPTGHSTAIRSNDELYEIYGELTVVQRIKLARFQWIGHVVRMETDDPARKVFLGRPQGQRRRGRAKLKLQDGVEASAIKAGMTDWQMKARDREQFWTHLRQAKTAKRLYRQISKQIKAVKRVLMYQFYSKVFNGIVPLPLPSNFEVFR